MTALIRGIRSVEFEVAALKESIRFYRDIWNLDLVKQTTRSAYFRGTSSYNHILAIHQTDDKPAIRSLVYEAVSREAVHAIHERVVAQNFESETPGPLAREGGGFGFGCKDAEGRNLVISFGDDDYKGENASEPDKPSKVSHANLNAGQYDTTTKFYTDVLGMRVIDESGRARFLHADCPEHFSLAIVNAKDATLNHVAFEMMDLDSVMRGAGRMKDSGYPIEWGVGRHGPGDNVFAYFAGPDEVPLEYTSEMLWIGEDYVSRGPDYWKFPSGRTDQWGITAPPTPRLARIQQLFRFTEAGFRSRQP
jgi:catechol 2,3-dioxygenase-like lactoylglutathione lyase family enzyme